MKDAYFFHLDEGSLQSGYRAMYEAYTRIFTRTGLTFRAVRAHSGAIGGDVSQEFHVLAASGEDAIAFSDADDYARTWRPPSRCRPPGASRPQQALRKCRLRVRAPSPSSRVPAGGPGALREDPHCRGR